MDKEREAGPVRGDGAVEGREMGKWKRKPDIQYRVIFLFFYF